MIEATFTLIAARLGARFLPPTRVFGWADSKVRQINRFAGADVAWVAWSIETISSWRWMRSHDLPRALAAHTMLRRRGIASRLCLGLTRDGQALVPHAWVEIGHTVVVGGATQRDARLSEFGGGSTDDP